MGDSETAPLGVDSRSSDDRTMHGRDRPGADIDGENGASQERSLMEVKYAAGAAARIGRDRG